MSEFITISKKDRICDLCGEIVHVGQKIVITRDDSMPGIVHYEHYRCPSTLNPQNKTSKRKDH